MDASRHPRPRSRPRPTGSMSSTLVLAALVTACTTSGGGHVDVATGSTPPTVADTQPMTASHAASSTPTPPVQISAVGDIIMGSTPLLPPDNGRHLFDAVAGRVAGDVTLVNMDETLTDDPVSGKCGAASSNCFAFRSPPSYAEWLHEAGFTVINLANNHSHDFGDVGLRDTQRALTAHGLLSTGMPGQVAVQTVRSVRIAILGFAPYGWAQSLLDIPAAQQLVRQAKAEAGLVIVTIHAGAEGADKDHVRPGPEYFLGENRGDPMAFSHAVIDAGADAVVGSGPHVLRGMEWYHERLIAYSLGNFLGYQTLSLSGPLGVGGILSIWLAPGGTWRGAA
jgi:poly-gamma-glutamate capsule biosynthesis protein CapA/YwtB (metallophosphatase superfamily)